MRFCCGITLFYPSQEELKVVDIYNEIFEKIYIYDNTDDASRYKNKQYFATKSKIRYISTEENKGLSIAYNTMCKFAIDDKFNYICLFDQDSIMSKRDIEKMLESIRKNIDLKVGIYAPEIVYIKDKNTLSQITLKYELEQIEWAISSGSFINLEIYEKTNGFDERYFIDRVDYDYCINLNRIGYKILQVKGAYLYQQLGEENIQISKIVFEHSYIRNYYMFRNRLYFYLKKNEVSLYGVCKVSILSIKHLYDIITRQTQKRKKLKMIYYAIRDFRQNKMGKYKGN